MVCSRENTSLDDTYEDLGRALRDHLNRKFWDPKEAESDLGRCGFKGCPLDPTDFSPP
jgi:hypothetical protein